MHKITISLEDEVIQFVDEQAKGNRSAFINHVLAEQRRLVLQMELIAALKQDAEDPEYQAEIEAWDGVVGDGIHA